MKQTICQLCSQKRECSVVKCDTGYLHGKNAVGTGQKGYATLSACATCAEKHRDTR